MTNLHKIDYLRLGCCCSPVVASSSFNKINVTEFCSISTCPYIMQEGKSICKHLQKNQSFMCSKIKAPIQCTTLSQVHKDVHGATKSLCLKLKCNHNTLVATSFRKTDADFSPTRVNSRSSAKKQNFGGLQIL